MCHYFEDYVTPESINLKIFCVHFLENFQTVHLSLQMIKKKFHFDAEIYDFYQPSNELEKLYPEQITAPELNEFKPLEAYFIKEEIESIEKRIAEAA